MANPVSVTALEQLLSDTVALMIETQGVHWNFAGGDFFEIHERTQVDYESLFLAVDEIAERIRSIGAPAPASLKAFAQRTGLAEANGLTGKDMVSALARSHKTVADTVRSALGKGGLDPGTEDLLIARLKAHETACWMWGAVAGGAAKPTAEAAPSVPARVEKVAADQPKKKSKKSKGKSKDKAKAVAKAVTPVPVKAAPKAPVVAKTRPAPARENAPVVVEVQPVPSAPVKVERAKSGRLIRIVKDTG